jgi:pimeloyl-[acyl-carrier protein] methyl ester esterase
VTRPALTLVLLPGMDGTGELFADFVDALGDAALPLVVAYPPDLALDYAGITEFARARLPRDRPYVLLGESFSGPVAIALAAGRPPGLLGLILCCTFARNPTPVFSMFKHMLGALPVSAASARLAAPFLVGTGSSCALRAALCQVSAAVMRGRMRAVLEVDFSAQMRAVNVPVLYLQAAQDRLVLGGSARHLAALAPHMQLRRLAGPHMLLQANAIDSALVVKQFIAAAQS